jgi:hypothetical protein
MIDFHQLLMSMHVRLYLEILHVNVYSVYILCLVDTIMNLQSGMASWTTVSFIRMTSFRNVNFCFDEPRINLAIGFTYIVTFLCVIVFAMCVYHIDRY